MNILINFVTSVKHSVGQDRASGVGHCFRYLEFWSFGGLEIQTRSPKLRNSPQRKQSNMDGGHYFQSIELDM